VPAEPANWSAQPTLQPRFAWRGVAGATGYRLQVATTTAFTTRLVDAMTSDLTYTPPSPLPRGGQLHWRVQALAGDLEGAWSAMWVVKLPALPAPVALAPLGGVPTAPVIYTWTPVPDATSYRLQVSRTPTFSSGVMVVTTTTTSAGLASWQTLPAGQTIYWRVQARGVAGDGLWSLPQAFVAP
jgi:hypothetical protein